MQHLIAAVTITTLWTLAGAPGALAQEALDSGEGQRFEVPAAGFAMTFPEDWIVWVPSEADVSDIVDAGGDALDEQTAEVVRILLSMGMSYEVFGLAPIESPDEVESCFALRVPNPMSLGLRDALEMNMFSVRAIPNLVGDPSATTLRLPAGPAGRMDYVVRLGSADGTVVDQAQSAYLLLHGTDMIVIGCTGTHPPDDRWLSIAQTVELLAPEEPSTVPSPAL